MRNLTYEEKIELSKRRIERIKNGITNPIQYFIMIESVAFELLLEKI